MNAVSSFEMKAILLATYLSSGCLDKRPLVVVQNRINIPRKKHGSFSCM